MSRIQEALKRLKQPTDTAPIGKSTQKVVPNRKENIPPTTVASESVEARNGGHSQPHHLSKDSGLHEQLPKFTISVPIEAMREHGLETEEANVELISQQFRRIKRPILNTAFDSGDHEMDAANLIMLASALPRSGKTFCAYNLARSIATERDYGAVLVDADVLRPTISRAFGLEKRAGLIDYLLNSSVSIDEILVGTDLNGIVAVPAGQKNTQATELLASRRMKQFVEALSVRFPSRAIVVDTPPLLMTNEAHVLAEHMGQIVLVVEAGVSTQGNVLQALSSLNRTKPINVILNKVHGNSFGEYSGYGYNTAP